MQTRFGYLQREYAIYDVYPSPQARWSGVTPIGEVVRVYGEWRATLHHEPDLVSKGARTRDEAVLDIHERLVKRAERSTEDSC